MRLINLTKCEGRKFKEMLMAFLTEEPKAPASNGFMLSMGALLLIINLIVIFILSK